MILTDREIQIAIEQGLITINPSPQPEAYSSTSLDLTLDRHISEFKTPSGGIKQYLDPSDPDFDHEEVLAALTTGVDIEEKDYLLQPHRLVLAWTREYVNLHSHTRMAARIEGKSSLARLGVAVHITAPTIHAGFAGQIRLEIVNHGSLPVRLKAGMRFCQLIFEQTLGTPERGYKGRFAGQDAISRKG